ncbi:MAG: hypothetical protein UIJ82_02640, partial [Collinsella sp.]|nr:hypothetical protein [Collinsella sp.]
LVAAESQETDPCWPPKSEHSTLTTSIPHRHDRDNAIAGNSHKVSSAQKLSKSSTTPLPALSLSFFRQQSFGLPPLRQLTKI